MQNVRCPKCGEEFSINETREFAYCSNCGEKLRIKDLLKSDSLATNNKNTADVPSSTDSNFNNQGKLQSKKSEPSNNTTAYGVGCVVILILFLLIFLLISSPNSSKSDASSVDSVRVDPIYENPANDTLAVVLDSSSSVVERYTPKTWDFQSSIDEMTDSKNIWATITSDNSVSLDFPYNDAYGAIVVRYMKKYGYDVLIRITSGQIYGSEYNNDNYVMVRFDNDKPIKYWYNESSDNSSDCVFIRRKSDFIKRCKKAKTIKVEVPIYQEGRPVFEFSVDEPLKWKE